MAQRKKIASGPMTDRLGGFCVCSFGSTNPHV